jgi:hypothetical protein
MSDMRWSIHLIVEEVKVNGEEKGPERSLAAMGEGQTDKSAVIQDLLQKKQKLIEELQTFKKTLSALPLSDDGGDTGNVDGED